MEDILICLIKVPSICLFFLSSNVFLWKQVTMSQRLAESVEEMPFFGCGVSTFLYSGILFVVISLSTAIEIQTAQE
jgi:hypothetical protein